VSCAWIQCSSGYTDVIFGRGLPRATRLGNEVISGSDEEIPLLHRPSALVVEDLHHVADLQIVGTFHGHFAVAGLGHEDLMQ
jgi:hypothetical protein